MFIFAFILSVLNISQILSGTSSSINDQAIKSKFGDSIPDSYICNYKDLKYSEYMVPVPPVPPVPGDAGAPQPKDKNDLVQNKNYVETFINMVGNIRINMVDIILGPVKKKKKKLACIMINGDKYG